ncbi:MAG: DUF4350 domain-containing protein, partial [Micrococcales bacterium]|nr:DUF4350 domain-containing protein [Micrococcales bacterium]
MSATYAPAAVVGDGTSGASRARSRWRRSRSWIALAAVVGVAAIIMVLPQPTSSGEPYAVNNPGADGSQALVRILKANGVRVTVVHSAPQALAQAGAGDTLAVVGRNLERDEARALAGTTADLVAIDVASSALPDLVPGTRYGGGTSLPTVRRAACDDRDAQAAATVVARASVRVSWDVEATVCFPWDDWGSAGAYVTLVVDDRRTVVLADGDFVRNDTLADEGHAALAIRALGRHDHLVWYVPTRSTTGTEELTMWDVMPPALPMLALHALVLFVVAALWRGRRLGPVVAEPLPVVVPAAEASRGRARLYRKMGARGRAASALRGGTARRLGARLGMPRSAPPGELIDAVARASRRPPAMVEAVLYGPPPA